MAEKQSEAGSISAPVAAKLIRVTESWLYQLVRDGWIKKQKGDRFTVVGTVHGYLDFKEDAERRAQQKAADNEVRRARAREINIRAAKMERELVAAEVAEGFVQATMGKMVSLLDGLPARYTRDLNERERLRACIDVVREEMADFAAKYGAHLRSGADDIDAEQEDDAGPVGEG